MVTILFWFGGTFLEVRKQNLTRSSTHKKVHEDILQASRSPFLPMFGKGLKVSKHVLKNAVKT